MCVGVCMCVCVFVFVYVSKNSELKQGEEVTKLDRVERGRFKNLDQIKPQAGAIEPKMAKKDLNHFSKNNRKRLQRQSPKTAGLW